MSDLILDDVKCPIFDRRFLLNVRHRSEVSEVADVTRVITFVDGGCLDLIPLFDAGLDAPEQGSVRDRNLPDERTRHAA